MNRIFDKPAHTGHPPVLTVGQPVRVIHRPASGPDIVIPATVAGLDPPDHCLVDTPHQKNQRIRQKHITVP